MFYVQFIIYIITRRLFIYDRRAVLLGVGERETKISYGKTIENPNNISYKKWISLQIPLHDTVR
jgi:hypothetical protein